MKTYHFELVLSASPSDEEDERLFECFEGRVSSAVTNGTPMLYLHLAAPSMDHAIQEAIDGVREVGLQVLRIELDPEVFLNEAA